MRLGSRDVDEADGVRVERGDRVAGREAGAEAEEALADVRGSSARRLSELRKLIHISGEIAERSVDARVGAEGCEDDADEEDEEEEEEEDDAGGTKTEYVLLDDEEETSHFIRAHHGNTAQEM
jgi:hypothetical protein